MDTFSGLALRGDIHGKVSRAGPYGVIPIGEFLRRGFYEGVPIDRYSGVVLTERPYMRVCTGWSPWGGPCEGIPLGWSLWLRPSGVAPAEWPLWADPSGVVRLCSDLACFQMVNLMLSQASNS